MEDELKQGLGKRAVCAENAGSGSSSTTSSTPSSTSETQSSPTSTGGGSTASGVKKAQGVIVRGSLMAVMGGFAGLCLLEFVGGRW